MGTSGGTRIVLGHWPRSPFGPLSDVMLERPDGERLLLAPTAETAEFIRRTYTYDTVRVTPVRVSVEDGAWAVSAGPLDVRFRTGRRGPLGRVLRAVPGPVAAHPAWCAVTDLSVRFLLPGVRTRGSAGGGRREWYGARDLHPVTGLSGTYEGADLGTLAPVDPPVRFGFGSVPRDPALTRITTTIELGAGERAVG
ncbi:hypothetical protein GCM10010329_30470 [Streptomyces spiroverticillatus]|uniref:DUF2071 domain-containing protein n=1 Tax=Streptomyces finlayi TaxID=67296 RepID=A0A918WW99_9ACTN|nr:hypothetical protein [Streptomyces finlayi]GHA05869.1 hypothetical protein GCM10010329_30470 [Streptomyces spiroverticillatus]GHC89604.1 hypothetical protein GCM10010334_22880 [Streptomyces finlayi]